MDVRSISLPSTTLTPSISIVIEDGPGTNTWLKALPAQKKLNSLGLRVGASQLLGPHAHAHHHLIYAKLLPGLFFGRHNSCGSLALWHYEKRS